MNFSKNLKEDMIKAIARFTAIFIVALLVLFAVAQFACAAPAITGKQIKLDSNILNWQKNIPATIPNLEGGANLINDLNIRLNRCHLFISTNGNWNMVMSEFINTEFMPDHPYLAMYGNIGWTTSPPVSVAHTRDGQLTIGNIKIGCMPSVAVGPKKVIDKLESSGVTVGDRVAIIKNQGNVLLVRKGNPENIFSVWDIGRPGIRLVTSDLDTEAGSGGNYSNTIYNIAVAQRGVPAATTLFNRIYNNDTVNDGDPMYMAWGPIMHRGVPQAIKNGDAQVAVVFYHLALQYTRQFPDDFEIIPLGGTVSQPDPLPGNKIAKFFIIQIANIDRINAYYADEFIDAVQDDDFTEILLKHGLVRP